MAQLKAHEVDRWLARPDPQIAIVLIYGPDRGLVSERASRFAETTGLPLQDPFSVVRIDAAEADQQGRLLDEARTVAMFSDRHLLWVRGAGAQSSVAADISELIAEPPSDCIVLIEGGDLKKGAALRSAVERGSRAMALPCYADDARGIDKVVDEVLSGAGLAISLEARQMLKASLGGDRLATRGELEKLALYCAGAMEVTIEDIRALTGDVSRFNADEAVDAVLCGRIADFDVLFTRLMAAGSPPFLILSAALRQVQALQSMRVQVDGGKPPSVAVSSARPPIFFNRRSAVELILQRWTQPMLQSAGARLQGAILRSREVPSISQSSTRQTLMALAIEGARASAKAS